MLRASPVRPPSARRARLLGAGMAVLLGASLPAVACAQAPEAAALTWPWWALALTVFALSAVLGVLALLAGIGGGVLFVPIVGGLLPFIHIDFIRGAGIIIAMVGALAAGPQLIREGLTDLRLSIPLALAASAGSYVGALVGLHLPEPVLQLSLGLVILATAVLMLLVRPRDVTQPAGGNDLAARLGLAGSYVDAHTGARQAWRPRALVAGLLLFVGIGFLAGLFGLGAGWANVPVLNLLMALPLRFSVATSYFILAIAGPAAALVYAARGALLPLVVAPAVLGVVLGARVGARLLVLAPTGVIRMIVIGVLFIAGLNALVRGLGA